ncbi:hypothetical protein D3C81_1593360 [compost metagenome]
MLRVFDNLAVDLNEYRFLYTRVLENFTDNPAISTAHNEHVLWIRMGEQRRMRDHFMIDEFIFDRSHDHAVQDEHASKFLSVNHRQILKIRLLRYKRFPDLRCNAERRSLFLSKPQFHRIYLLSVRIVFSRHIKPLTKPGSPVTLLAKASLPILYQTNCIITQDEPGCDLCYGGVNWNKNDKWPVPQHAADTGQLGWLTFLL